ncbi:MAG TPA: Lrp/AsnC family transcriptional regulator [Candidatus Faecivivens stercoripullorum]|uniref:Lrp/AsnC family transcriptional regulator n=1 Tax=Candidatus Faecivivens stercoripullorum TaxID=2840805 RepID=A0A9D1H547_9FIRM|nr:Lrp/AsnC family transcriptional regulator [Candidatus Faecivivens stercoripullorum]
MDKLLQILSGNARMETRKIAVMMGESEEAVSKQIETYEKAGVIRGYKPLLDYDKIEDAPVEAIIEVRVSPQRNYGFEEIAKRIADYDEVESVYLMSGGYDLHLRVVGHSFKDIALFVSQRLAVLDGVLSTATHFLLSRYKENGVIMGKTGIDERRNVSF